MCAIVRLSSETRLIIVIIKCFVIARDRPHTNAWNAVAHMMALYRWLLGTSRQSVGALLMVCLRTDSFSYSEWITDTVCPRRNHLVCSAPHRMLAVAMAFGTGETEPSCLSLAS